ncbi:MAG: IS982 family transposase [Akkermansiaceae bacterium]|nr:IS982 family transposase [Akkermansiaceae bacterium]
MFSTEEFIIAVFCCVDDALKSLFKAYPITIARGFAPHLTPAEVVTMELVGEYRGLDTDKGIWQYFRGHWHALFPELASRTSFTRQAANLWQYKHLLQQQFAEHLGVFDECVHLVDGLPIVLCNFRHAPRCASFQAEASYGYCAAKAEHFYGFHGHLSVTLKGVITGFTVSAANGNEREALWETLEQVKGLVIGDKGYLSQSLQAELAEYGVELVTPVRANMNDKLPKAWTHLLLRLRRLIETVNSQLSERFHFEKVWARDRWHLTSRINRKVLAHTVCCFLNHQMGRELLHFDTLVVD